MPPRSASGSQAGKTRKKRTASTEVEGVEVAQDDSATNVSNTPHTQAGQRKRVKKDTVGKEKPDEALCAPTKAEATDDLGLSNIVGLEGVTFHPRYCNADGSVALIIDETLFRLSRSSLARKSAWLEQRFKEKLNPPPLTLPDGCPVLKINSRLCADDFAMFLDAMEDVALLVKQPSFETIAAVLRSSTTLGFLSFREWAINCLELLWPDNPAAVTAAYKSNAAETLQLARHYDVPSVVRPVMYELARSEKFGEVVFSRPKGHRNLNDEDVRPLLSENDIVTVIAIRSNCASNWLRGAMRGTSSDYHCGCIKYGARWRALLESRLATACLYDPAVGFGLLAGTVPPDVVMPQEGSIIESTTNASANGAQQADNSYDDGVADKETIRRTPILWTKQTMHAKCRAKVAKKFLERRQVMWEAINEHINR